MEMAVDTSNFVMGKVDDIKLIEAIYYNHVWSTTGRRPWLDANYHYAKQTWTNEQGCVVNGQTAMWQSNEHRVEFILKWT
jgi:hypothetical protein